MVKKTKQNKKKKHMHMFLTVQYQIRAVKQLILENTML